MAKSYCYNCILYGGSAPAVARVRGQLPPLPPCFLRLCLIYIYLVHWVRCVLYYLGTGKSVTGACIAYVFAQDNKSLSTHKCVLYCGPSNKSVDVVFGKLVIAIELNSQ